MASREIIRARLKERREDLELANTAYRELLSGRAQSYTIGSRSLTRLDLKALEDTIRKLEKEIDEMESSLRGGSRRRAVGVIPRDF